MPEAQVNFFCPEQRAAFMRRPCEGFWAKIAEARKKWPNHQFHFPLNQCDGCKGDKLVPPKQEEKAVVEAEKGKMVRTRIHEAMDKLVPAGGSTTKRALADHIGISVPNLTYHLEKMHGHNLVVITPFGDGLPDQVSWPTPPGETLPDKAVEVQKKEELPEFVQGKGEKAGIVQEHDTPSCDTPSHDKVEHPTPERDGVEHPEAERRTLEPGEVELRAQTIRLCKNNDGRPAHKLSVYCLECCQENLKKNQEKGKEKPKVGSAASVAHREETFKIILAKFPIWDPLWGTALTEKWWEIFQKLWDMARELDGTEQ